MGFDLTGFGALFDFGSKILDKVFPNKAEAEAAKLKLMEMQLNGELAMIDKQLSAIIAEANSADKWTSRARPAFMYVMYIMMLSSIPFGIAFVISPQEANNFVTGFQAFLGAIPDSLYDVFMVGFLGYTGARTIEKRARIIQGGKEK